MPNCPRENSRTVAQHGLVTLGLLAALATCPVVLAEQVEVGSAKRGAQPASAPAAAAHQATRLDYRVVKPGLRIALAPPEAERLALPDRTPGGPLRVGIHRLLPAPLQGELAKRLEWRLGRRRRGGLAHRGFAGRRGHPGGAVGAAAARGRNSLLQAGRARRRLSCHHAKGFPHTVRWDVGTALVAGGGGGRHRRGGHVAYPRGSRRLFVARRQGLPSPRPDRGQKFTVCRPGRRAMPCRPLSGRRSRRRRQNRVRDRGWDGALHRHVAEQPTAGTSRPTS